MYICVIKKYVYIWLMKYDCLVCLLLLLFKSLLFNFFFYNFWLVKMYICIYLNIYIGSYNLYFCIYVLIYGNVWFFVFLLYLFVELVNLKLEKICYI